MKVHWMPHPSLKRNNLPQNWIISYTAENGEYHSDTIGGELTSIGLSNLRAVTKYSISVRAVQDGFESEALIGSVKTAKKAPSQAGC